MNNANVQLVAFIGETASRALQLSKHFEENGHNVAHIIQSGMHAIRDITHAPTLATRAHAVGEAVASLSFGEGHHSSLSR